MNIWRMKLRAGDYGPDMLPSCQERGIASMTHPPIYNTDLTHLAKKDLDPEVKTAARSSIWRFAWDIQGGDIVFIGDSVSKSIIAKGYVRSTPGTRAYYYNDHDPMTEPGNPAIPWRHEIPVAWDNDFVPFPYRDGAGRITVMHYDPRWAKNAGVFTKGTEGTDVREAELLNEQAYMRETQSSQKNVLRLHAALSNRFRSWIERRFGETAVQEQSGIDIHFTHDRVTHLAELKICYGANTRLAIREALGQVFEYNHYPPRQERQSWWIVLDCRPSKTDIEYVALLTEKYQLPLSLAWQVGTDFEVSPQSLLS